MKKITHEQLDQLRKDELAKKIENYIKNNRERQKRYRAKLKKEKKK